MQKNIGTTLVLCTILVTVTACGPMVSTTVTGGGPSLSEAQSVPYNGPKARVAVSRFTDKTGKGFGKVGEGMSDMLATSLFQSNRFIVLEREQLGDVMQEQDLGASGRMKKETAAPVGEIEGAELLVSGSLTSFEPNTGGGGAGLLIPGGALLGGGLKKSYVAIDLRVIDAKTSRIVMATTVEGTSTDVGALAGFVLGPLPIGLGGWSKTPVEKAVRICIQNAVNYLASQTPPNYFHNQ